MGSSENTVVFDGQENPRSAASKDTGTLEG